MIRTFSSKTGASKYSMSIYFVHCLCVHVYGEESKCHRVSYVIPSLVELLMGSGRPFWVIRECRLDSCLSSDMGDGFQRQCRYSDLSKKHSNCKMPCYMFAPWVVSGNSDETMLSAYERSLI